MGHPALRKKSKRLTCSRKYKIQKRVREHNRKKRKELKGKNTKGAKAGVVTAPNLCPFKEQILEEMNAAKVLEKETIKQNMEESQTEEPQKAVSILKDLVADAEKRGTSYIDRSMEILERKLASIRKAETMSLAREFRKVVAAADIILEVVDARDPLGTRCKIVEETVMEHPGKRLVIVVNKADLVPRNILESWLTYLRGNFPAVPFKASIQKQTQKLGRKNMVKKSKKKQNLEKLMSVSSCVGAELLMKLLANYRRNKGISTSCTVGVVGMPNVGKSSVINSLKRSKSCKVGAEAGVTRNMQTVQIGSMIKILDSPGIVIENPFAQNQSILMLKNVLNADRIQDPIVAASAILQRATKQQIMDLYAIKDNYSTPENFLNLMAARLGLLRKGGIPDIWKAARTLINDWNRGKIRYYTLPPEENVDTHVSAEIVSTMKEEFNIDDFKPEQNKLLDLISETEMKDVLYLNVKEGPGWKLDEELGDDVVVDTAVATKKSGKLRWRKKKRGTSENDKIVLQPGVIRQKKLQKMEAKKKRKQENRNKMKAIISFNDNQNKMDID